MIFCAVLGDTYLKLTNRFGEKKGTLLTYLIFLSIFASPAALAFTFASIC